MGTLPAGATLSIEAVAGYLGCSRRTIYNYIRDGRLKTVHIGMSQRVFVSSLKDLKRPLIGQPSHKSRV